MEVTLADKSSKGSTLTILIGVIMFVLLLLMLPMHLSEQSEQNSIEVNAQYFEDNDFTSELDEIQKLPESEWSYVENSNFGLSSHPFWLKIKIPKSESQYQQRLLLINYAMLDNVDLWFFAAQENNIDAQNTSKQETDGNFNQLLAAYRTGDSYPYEHRVIKHEQFLFQIPKSDTNMLAYLRVSSKGPIKVPIEIWDESDFIEYSSLNKLFIGLFFGYMVAMGLSNLFVFASTRNIIFAIYTGYVTSIALAVAALHGVAFHYLWPNNTWMQEFGIPIFAALTMIFIISLTIRLLALKKKAPIICKLLSNIRWIFIALLCMCLVLPYEVIIKSLLVLLLITTPVILTAGVSLAINGSLVARYFCAAWAVLLISGVSIAMENFGFYNAFIDNSYLIMIGAITEALLLALALSISFNEQLKKSKQTRNLAIQNEHEALAARDELIALQDKNQAELEYSIEERTLELEIALRELAEKNTELEKLSAIDPLTGLMNRRFFDKRLLAESRRSKREVTPLSIAMLDIDFFKKINDTHGHMAGDYCLKVFASVLKEHVKRPSDVVCRYGGEEFVLILPNTPQDGLEKLLEKVRAAVENKKVMFEAKQIEMTVSIGGCSRTIASEDEHTLIMAFVDKQLYQAKASGRNRVVIDSY